MAQKTGTPVAEPETAAPSPSPDVQTQAKPETVAPETAAPESEGGEEKATTETGAQAFLKFMGSIDDPDVADSLMRALKPEVREKTATVKDVRGRSEQRGHQRAMNELELRGKDLADHDDAKGRRDAAVSALATDDDMDAATRSRHAKALQTTTEEVHDYERKQELFRIISGSPGYDEYGDEDVERLSRVDGKPLPTWFREHIQTYGDVRDRLGFERGKAAAGQSVKAQEKLEEAMRATEEAGAERPGAPARTPGGAPGGPMALEQFNALPLDEQAKVTPSERSRMYAESDARRART